MTSSVPLCVAIRGPRRVGGRGGVPHQGDEDEYTGELFALYLLIVVKG
jgi:hypothetical protein